MVPCNECNEFNPMRDMLASDREQHRYWSPKLNKICPGKTCAQCTHEICRAEAHELGLPDGESPSLEQCSEAIALEKRNRICHRMQTHNKCYKMLDAKHKADKAAGIFHFNKGSKKERRSADYKELFGKHLVDMCEAGKLFSTFNDFSIKMDRLRTMCANADLLAEEGASVEAQSKAYDDVEDAFFRNTASEYYSDSDVEQMQNAMERVLEPMVQRLLDLRATHLVNERA